MKQRGYYGVYTSQYDSSRLVTRVMIHYIRNCQFFSSYGESFFDKEKGPIKVEDWIYGDIQERLQDSFGCEELGEKDLNRFKK